MFVLILRQKLQRLAKKLIDCLITPKSEGHVMGDVDAETFLLLVSDVLEIAEDEIELKVVVVVPLGAIFIGVKEELYKLFCTGIDVACSGQKESILLEEMRKDENDSSSRRMRLSQKLDCPELGIQKVEVCV